MKNNIILPRTDEDGNYYLSYSQKRLWKESKRDYIRKYFLGEKDVSYGLERYGDFGKLVGEAFEHGDYSKFNDKDREFLKKVPRFDEFEREVRLQLDGFYLKGFIDTSTKPEQVVPKDLVGPADMYGYYIRKIADYKTGDIQMKGSSMVDYSSKDYDQIEIYCAALRQEFGIAPDEAYVYLLGRQGNAFKGQRLSLTRKMLPIQREITDEILDRAKEDVQRVGEEISSYYKQFLILNKVV